VGVGGQGKMKLLSTPNHRLNNLRKELKTKRLDAMLVSKQANRYYLTGWPGDVESGYLLITSRKALVLTDSRYTEEVGRNVRGFELLEFRGRFAEFLSELLKELSLKRVGFESHDLSVFLFGQIRKNSRGIKLVPVAFLLENLREEKDDQEVKLIKKAASIADEAFSLVKRKIRLGMKEVEIALMLERLMREKGADGNAWEPLIVGSGPNSSMVHYGAGERALKKGDTLLLDWGCVYKGYCCDISRVLFLGEPDDRQKEVYNLVLEAQKLSINKVRAGVKAQEVEKAAREFLKDKTDFSFGHSIGHGVGLEVHELPRVNKESSNELKKGQVITVEPGVYIPDWGGVRIEDTVLVKESGSETLTNSAKELKEITIRL
jgi:Xaa-Pro aminopeptidase